LRLSDFKKQFLSILKDDYPHEETNSFFNLLMEEYVGMKRLDLALQPQKEISASEENKFREALKRLLNHEPIQYIIGGTEFFRLKFVVNNSVLIPRPETEELVQWILDDLQINSEENISILDIGTGSGCIAISLAKKLPKAKVSAIEISEEALKIAKLNAQLNNVDIRFDLVDVLSIDSLSRKFDIIVSNPPYVRELEKDQMHKNVLENEPHLALYVKDEDPLHFYRKITKLAENGLKDHGKLYFEINQYLGEDTRKVVELSGFKASLKKDIFGKDRMLKGTKF
jgi:release factor glutamine methyltransferase